LNWSPVAQANRAEDIEIICVVVKEANLVTNNAKWICDTRASTHFCANKELIQHFKDVTNGECVYIGNSAIARVMGKRKILLKFTSAKLLSLSNVLYVPSLQRNLVSGIFPNKARLKTVVGDDKVIISHNGVFVRKGYLNGSLFVVNHASETMNENASSSAYIAEYVDLGHGRLRHVTFAPIKQLKNIKPISMVNVDNFTKCSVCRSKIW